MQPSIPGLVVLPAHNPGPMTGAGNQTYLLLGRVPTLIDAGVGAETHLDALAAALAAVGQELARVVVTHAHSDHVSGAPAIASRWPGATFHKLPGLAPDARYPVTWKPLVPHGTITAGDVDLTVVPTPGHAPDHVCLWHVASRTLFGGDLLTTEGTVVIPGRRGGNMTHYLASLAAVAALEPSVVLPAHGPPITDPLGLIRRYSEHRTTREREVLAAIATGATTADAIVARVYAGVAGELRAVAEETVYAHLYKLVQEGRLLERGSCFVSPTEHN
jgi:ribonuclease/clavin/mitogillin